MKRFSILKSISYATLFIAPLVSANARQLDPEEALQRALSASGAMHIPGNRHLSLSYTESYEDNDYVYVFNNSDKGFIVVSADDRMHPVLGYSDSGIFDPDKVSPSLRWWLSQYAEEAAQVSHIETVNATGTDDSQGTPADDKEKIPYLIKTKWGQNYPYNLDCPELNGKDCVTGCVATAMAQIIKYHGYPETGSGSNSYEWNDSTLTFDYAEAKFNFADMIDSYKIEYSDEQKAAVADLLYACGVSVNMSYSPKESGASDVFIAYALRNYFKFDNRVKLLKKDFYSASGWEDMIYGELKEGRPVIMGGQANDGGHQFICDGYEGDGFFHINWGWEGLSDGYYLLTALTPTQQGTGGHNGGYNSNQSAICGIQPPVQDSDPWYPVYADNSVDITRHTNTSVNVAFANGGGIFNYSQQTFETEVIIKVVSEKDGQEYLSASGAVLTFSGAKDLQLSGYGGLGTLPLPEGLPEGKYKCYVVLKTPEGNIQEILYPYTSVSYAFLEVKADGSISCTPGIPEATAEIRVTKFEPQGQVLENEPTVFDITIENIGEIDFEGIIHYCVYSHASSEPLATSYIQLNTIAPEKKLNATLEVNFTFNPGLYDIIFFNQYEEIISDTFTISLEKSGVSSILNQASCFDIYSPSGLLIMSAARKEQLNTLPKGTYILKSGAKSVKFIK